MKQLSLFISKEKRPKKLDDKFVLEQILNEIPYPVYPEYQFTSTRKFRFDWFVCIGNKGIGIEYDGGIYTGGRHLRAEGFIRDTIKLNLALSLGIPTLRYTLKQMQDPDQVKAEILKTISVFIHNQNK